MNRFLKSFIKLALRISAVAAVAAGIAFIAERIEELKTWGAELKHKPYGIYERFVKRPLDCFLSTGALIVFSPILVITAILVRIKLGSPILFSQDRIGRNEKIFRLYKFRSMTNERDENGKLLPDEIRLTKFGTKLRSTSFDELPELFSIVKGDMAIIGPRPLLPEYLPYFEERERTRHEVRGGLTVPEVLLGKTHTTWDEQFVVESKYARHITFLTDVKIILSTIKILFKRANSDFGGDVRKPLNEVRIKERN